MSNWLNKSQKWPNFLELLLQISDVQMIAFLCNNYCLFWSLKEMPKWLGIVNTVASEWHVFYNYEDKPFYNVWQRKVELSLSLSYISISQTPGRVPVPGLGDLSAGTWNIQTFLKLLNIQIYLE